MFQEGLQKGLQEDEQRYLQQCPPSQPHRTVSDLEVKPLYTPLDIAGVDYQRDIGFPGEYPYTRGPFPTGFLSRPWNLRQVVGLGTAEETNQRWKYLLSQGQTALAVVGAVKSGMGTYGYDTDDERTLGFAGKDGVNLDSLADYQTLFDGIDLRRASVHLITSSAIALACYIAIGEEQGLPPAELRGSMSNAVRPTKECIDIIEYCAREMPSFNATYIDVRNVREAGCTAPQEIAFGVGLGMAAAQAVTARGIDIDQFGPRVSWFVNAGPEFFEEVAKFRAMRRLWARTMKETLGAKDPRSWRLRAHVQTYAPSLTYQQPLNNIVRSTLYALAAVLGGAQSLSVNSFDEALAIPTELSATLSLRTQQIIYFETGVAGVVDPLGGSYYVESLTNRLEEAARRILDQVQTRGGAFQATDWMREEVRKAAFQHQKEIEEGQRVWVGVNAFAEEEDHQLKLVTSNLVPISRYDPALRDKQIARLEKVRRERDQARAAAAKERLRAALARGENMLPPIIEAVKASLTVGELSQIRREVLGAEEPHSFFCG